jgi:SAM-dependent methyltransferase
VEFPAPTQPDDGYQGHKKPRGVADSAPAQCAVCEGPLAPEWGDEGPFEVLRCRACRLGVTWPPPKEANGEEDFSDDDSHYERQLSERSALWRRFGDALLDQVPAAHRGGRLLDVGSGVGLLVRLAEERGWSAMGIDRAPAAARVARGHGIDVRRVELEEVTEFDFDVVVMMHVLEHVFDPVGFVRSAAKHIRPGGLLVVNVPISDGLMPRLLGRRWYGFQPDQHVHQFSRHALRAVALRSGLQPVRVTSESLHYAHGRSPKEAALRFAATSGRLLRRGDQATLLARR